MEEQGDYVSSGHAGAAATKTTKYAGMAELADALDSGASEVTFVQVQVLLPAPTKRSFCSFFVFRISSPL